MKKNLLLAYNTKIQRGKVKPSQIALTKVKILFLQNYKREQHRKEATEALVLIRVYEYFDGLPIFDI